ncbi:MAG TPA: hypothetical protein VHD35_10705 [Chitinophagaceae bacterium]|nr:hypothetical protein [Chitinophagaceae bacterium]
MRRDKLFFDLLYEWLAFWGHLFFVDEIFKKRSLGTYSSKHIRQVYVSLNKDTASRIFFTGPKGSWLHEPIA